MSRDIVAYVDGSYNDNIPNYGSGIVILGDMWDEPKEYSQAGAVKEWIKHRNISGELQASLIAINIAIRLKCDKLTIYHDLEGTYKWSIPKRKGEQNSGWSRNNSLTNYYFDAVDSLRSHLEIKFIQVKGHSNNKYNDMADTLARKAVGLE